MHKDLVDHNAIPAIFWLGHLAVALIGFVLLLRHRSEVRSARRSAYFAVGGLLILVGLVPAAFASMITVALVLGALALANAPVGVPVATAIASLIGLLSGFVVVYLVVLATRFMFVRLRPPTDVAATQSTGRSTTCVSPRP